MRLHVLLLLAAAKLAGARELTIQNHSFEANFAAPNSFPVLVPSGWTLFDPAGIIDQNRDAVGCLNPTGSTFFPAGAPHGNNVALIYLEGDRGGGVVGLSQSLGAVLAPHTRYTLRAEVGNIASGFGAPPFNSFFDLDGFPGYAVQLLAGGVVVAEDHNSMFATIPEGEFRRSIVVLDVSATHPRLGQQLAVRVVNLNIPGTPEAPGIEVDFDDIHLVAEPIAACVGDFNADGGVDGDDVIAFFGAWDMGAISADVNADEGVDGDDVIAFFAAWDAGC